MSLHKSVKALAGVVAMKGDDTVEIQLAKLALQNLNLNLLGALPKLAIEIQPAPRPTRTLDVPQGLTTG